MLYTCTQVILLFFSWMYSVSARNNSLSGSIPSQVFMLPNLNSLYLKSNKLNGTIPHNVSENVLFNSTLSELDLSDNKLSGSFPPSVLNLTNLSKLYILVYIA